ncbi:CatA-like O-acetyltransferase [Algibacter mikhailovii]|uniref:Chloramphenicol acetyltransferase n=1 Tax=Algibacter mikhailovii TaxID=425498 RepID=A0A918QUA9_9FLAO|nr:CatA-like O-acetyltransferase [Algibacter mikhailovii]GGZ70567.1 chloramphenicol acetyltransferase [Algibacter mikhailovii]
MKFIDKNTWKRKQLFDHFSRLSDPYFGLTIPFDVTKAYQFTKENNISFFGKYLHDCMKAINDIENFRYRIEQERVVLYDTIHASATMMRTDHTFGFSFIDYDEDLNVFLENIREEKARVMATSDLYPPINGQDCIHCSAIPWVNFSGHKEPVSGELESVPRLAFAKTMKTNDKLIMNVAISVNHALVDGYHVGLFSEKFQMYLNQ